MNLISFEVKIKCISAYVIKLTANPTKIDTYVTPESTILSDCYTEYYLLLKRLLFNLRTNESIYKK
jgi:hypothetical protein